MKFKITSIVSAIFFSQAAFAQSDSVTIAQTILRAPNKYAAEVDFLNNMVIGVKEFEGRYYFAPPPVVDWEKFSSDVAGMCDGQPSGTIAEVDLHVQFYSPETRNAIAAAGGISVELLQTVPSYGLTVFVEDSDQVAHQIFTNVDPAILRAGETLSSAQDLVPSRKFRIKRDCELMLDIASVKDLHVAYHAVGQTFTKSGIRAELLLGQEIDSFFDLTDEQKETEQTTVSVSTGGSGFAVDLGPLSFSDTNASTSTSTSVQKFRVVNRNWVARRAESVVRSLNIEQVCQGVAECGDSALVDLIVEFVTNEAAAQTAKIQLVGDNAYELFVGSKSVGSAVLNIDETSKATLNSLFDASSEEEAEGKVGAYSGKYKRKDTNKLDLDGNTEFTRNGEDWIPTSMDVYLVDYASLEGQTRASYSKTVLEGLENVSFPAPQAVVPGLAAGFIDSDYLEKYPYMERKIADLQARYDREYQKRTQARAISWVIHVGDGNGFASGNNGHVHTNTGHFKDHNCYHPVDANYAKNLCGSEKYFGPTLIFDVGGGTCGHATYVISCVNTQ